MMMRIRLLWFAAGFATTGAAMAQFMWMDLVSSRTNLISDMTQKFEDLEIRVSKIESESSHGASD